MSTENHQRRQPHWLTALAASAFALSATAAPAAAPEGHWTGQIDAPGRSVEIAIDLKQNSGSRWVGQIDIPSQGLNDFPLGSIAVDGARVSFAMQGMPGTPTFEGSLDDDGQKLAGKFGEGGSQLPFHLRLSGSAQIASVEPTPAIPDDVAAALAGRWEGELAVSGKRMRVALVLVADAERGLSASLDSIDQGQLGLPVSRLTIADGMLRAELSFANAVLEGRLNAARNEWVGTWQQGEKTLPLTLRKAADTAAAAFPAAEPETVGIPGQALAQLDNQIQALVDRHKIVGGELLVIKNRRTVFRKAFGWKDRESGLRLDSDAIYSVRSMTKPLVGSAIQMLIDDGRLQLDTPVRTLLPAFDLPRFEHVTVEHLLTHSAGFPFTTMRNPLLAYAGLDAVATEAARAELLFAPGSGFQYSDAGSDILGAIVATVSGLPLERFLQQRILDPLRMADSVTLLGNRANAAQRIPSAYSGGTGQWTKHWEPSDPPMFPIFLGSQSMYASTMDYAKFLAWWMDRGVHDGEPLLSADAVARALTPAHRIEPEPYPGTSGEARTEYGQQWMLRTRSNGGGGRELAMFGHDGSDGTYAWAWPEHDLIVLFFTQSRGTLAGREVMQSVETLLIEQRPDAVTAPAVDDAATRTAGIAGLYWDQDVAHAYYVITPFDDRVELDRPGVMHLVFRPEPGAQRYVAEANPDVWIAFDRGADGNVVAMRTFFGKRIETDPRQTPVEGLPSVKAIIAKVRRAHRIERLPTVGAVHLSGSIDYVSRKMAGRIDHTFDMQRSRLEIAIGPSRQIALTDGSHAWSETSETGIDQLSGRMLQQVLLDRWPALLGDWRTHYEHVSVLNRINFAGRSLVMLRLVPTEGAGDTLYVDETSGELVRRDSLVQIPGIGIAGVQTMFDDYREVGGMRIPFHSKSLFQHPLIGIVEVQYEKAETDVPTTATMFSAVAANDAD